MKSCPVLSVLSLLLALSPAYGLPSFSAQRSQSESPGRPDESSRKERRAESFVDSLSAGQFNAARDLLSVAVRQGLGPKGPERLWQSLVAQNGKFKRRMRSRVELLGPHTMVFVPLEFESSTLDLKVVFSKGASEDDTESSLISGLFVEPHRQGYAQPSYVVPSRFSDKEMEVVTGRFKLPAIFSLPSGDGPFPAVILVHGSGPQDADESIGSNKPFRDIAGGLASRGIAVLRYEKRTLVYRTELSKDELERLTVKEESIEDVLSAVKLLRELDAVDKSRIVVVGHSLGGMLIPRIAAADTGDSIAAFVSLAGSNTPLEDALVRQTSYLASLGGPGAEAAQEKLVEMKKLSSQIKSLDKSGWKNFSGPILGAGKAYWMDLAEHDPLAEVRKMKRPIFFLQGGRDYQVTEKDDYANWKRAFESGVAESSLRDDQFRFKLYKNLNHLFMDGSGMSTPSEYLSKSGNVDKEVIDDIADFITGLPTNSKREDQAK